MLLTFFQGDRSNAMLSPKIKSIYCNANSKINNFDISIKKHFIKKIFVV